MGIEINTGYSCYLSAARRRRGQFFSPIGSGPGGSSLWNGDREKHWVQLLFDSGSSSPGAFFFPSGSGPLGSDWQHVATGKPWVQLLFDSGSSFYFQVDLGPGAAVGGMRLEINTGYSYYLTVARRPWGRFYP